MRDANAHEDRMLSDQVKNFERDTDKLAEVNARIDEYRRSNKDQEFDEVEQRLLHNATEIKGLEDELSKLKPEMDTLKKQVEDG